MQQGGCLCGAVRYRVEGRPSESGICHCRSCRRTASAPTLPYLVFPAKAFAFTKGSPAAFHSSPHVTRSFCGQCGSPLTYRTEERPDCVEVMTCSLDDPAAFPPGLHIWVSHSLSWDRMGDGLVAHATAGPAG